MLQARKITELGLYADVLLQGVSIFGKGALIRFKRSRGAAI